MLRMLDDAVLRTGPEIDTKTIEEAISPFIR